MNWLESVTENELNKLAPFQKRLFGELKPLLQRIPIENLAEGSEIEIKDIERSPEHMQHPAAILNIYVCHREKGVPTFYVNFFGFADYYRIDGVVGLGDAHGHYDNVQNHSDEKQTEEINLIKKQLEDFLSRGMLIKKYYDKNNKILMSEYYWLKKDGSLSSCYATKYMAPFWQIFKKPARIEEVKVTFY